MSKLWKSRKMNKDEQTLWNEMFQTMEGSLHPSAKAGWRGDGEEDISKTALQANAHVKPQNTGTILGGGNETREAIPHQLKSGDNKSGFTQQPSDQETVSPTIMEAFNAVQNKTYKKPPEHGERVINLGYGDYPTHLPEMQTDFVTEVCKRSVVGLAEKYDEVPSMRELTTPEYRSDVFDTILHEYDRQPFDIVILSMGQTRPSLCGILLPNDNVVFVNNGKLESRPYEVLTNVQADVDELAVTIRRPKGNFENP